MKMQIGARCDCQNLDSYYPLLGGKMLETGGSIIMTSLITH